MARGINEAGQVVGDSETASGDEHAFLLDRGRWHDRPRNPWAVLTSTASDINEAAQVVGRAATLSGDEHAFLWTMGVASWTSGRSAAPARGARRRTSTTPERWSVCSMTATIRGFYWTAADGMVELPALTGIESAARAINSAGRIVGYGDISTGDAHAVIWRRGVQEADFDSDGASDVTIFRPSTGVW